MTYKEHNDNQINEERHHAASESIPSRSADERVKDALSLVQEALGEPSAISNLLNIEPEYRRGRELAIAYLSYRPRSSGKVRVKLLAKEIDPAIANDVIGGLVRDGYIDDRKVAFALLRERRGRKAEAYRIALQRLIAGGIPKWVALEAIAKTENETAELTLLASYLKAKFRKDLLYLRDGDPSLEEMKTLRTKLIKAAQQRGFLFSDAQKLMDTWFRNNG